MLVCAFCIRSSERVADVLLFFFQAEDGIRDLVRSRGLGDVYKRQVGRCSSRAAASTAAWAAASAGGRFFMVVMAGPFGSEVSVAVSYTHLRAHETVLDLVCRLLLAKKK